MDKREAQEVVNETVNSAVSGYIIALMIIAALPVIGWVLLLGLLGAVAFPGVVVLIVVGLFIWGWIGGKQQEARLRRERAARDARSARLKAPYGGKDRYFVREGDTIKLMCFYRNEYVSSDVGGYCWSGAYTLRTTDDDPYVDAYYSSAAECRKNQAMWGDPKRLAHWQAVFEEWVETGVKPPYWTWWMFPDEAAQYAEREAQYQERLKIAVCPENSLTSRKVHAA